MFGVTVDRATLGADGLARTCGTLDSGRRSPHWHARRIDTSVDPAADPRLRRLDVDRGAPRKVTHHLVGDGVCLALGLVVRCADDGLLLHGDTTEALRRRARRFSLLRPYPGRGDLPLA